MEILTIGSAHLDAVAEFDLVEQSAISDKIGSSVTLSFGGVALNVTAHLRDLGQDAYILTAFNRNTVAGRTLYSALRSGGIPRNYVLHDGNLPDSAYVGHMTGGRVESAISVMSVGESRELDSHLESVIPKFGWVVFDCNLSRGMIGRIAKICRAHDVNLVGLATSDAKAPRLTEASVQGMRAASMNRVEAEQLIGLLPGASARSEVFDDAALSSLRSWLNTEYLMVTAGRDGWYLVDEASVTHHDRPEGIVPVNTLGAGDAAVAGLVDSLVQQSSIPEGVNRAVARALRSQYPTGFAETTSPEAWLQQRRRARILGAARYVTTVGAALVIELLFLAALGIVF